MSGMNKRAGTGEKKKRTIAMIAGVAAREGRWNPQDGYYAPERLSAVAAVAIPVVFPS